jgi:hypothetical protein
MKVTIVSILPSLQLASTRRGGIHALEGITFDRGCGTATGLVSASFPESAFDFVHGLDLNQPNICAQASMIRIAAESAIQYLKEDCGSKEM